MFWISQVASESDIIEGIVSHTTDEDNYSFTDDLCYLGPLTNIPSLTVIDEEDEVVEDYPEHDFFKPLFARYYYGGHQTICCC